MTNDIDEIIEFVLSNTNGEYKRLPAEDFVEAIEKHIEYGTFMQVRDDKGLAAIARWNWTADDEVKVLDCVVRKDMRSARMIKYLINLAHNANKNIKYFKYDRLFKYPYGKERRFQIGG
jgi:hypothetical protein